MDDKKLFTGFGVVAAILLLVALFRSGSDSDYALAAMRDNMAGADKAIAAFGERLDGIESRIKEVAASADVSEDLNALRAEIDDVASAASASLGARMEELEADLTDRFASVEGKIGEMAETARNAAKAASEVAVDVSAEDSAAAEDTEATENATAPETTEAAVENAPTDGLAAGQTLVAADGALRVFVSRVAGGEARLSVNGRTKTLGEGDAVTVPVADDHCRVTVDAASGEMAALSALCGDDMPAPEGVAVGKTAIFEDGALRSFVSRVDEDSARLAVNGDLVTLAVGRSVAAMAGDTLCRVSLDAVDRGHASLSAACGDALPVSDLVGPGDTALFGDGAARVFVVALDGDAVRYAVNGQTVISGGSGDGMELDSGCKVTVEDVSDAGAVFSHGCD